MEAANWGLGKGDGCDEGTVVPKVEGVRRGFWTELGGT
jgi:hypothetical protein